MTQKLPPTKPHPELDKLLEQAKAQPPLTEREKRIQAESWARQDKD